MDVTHARIATLDVAALTLLVTSELGALIDDPDSPPWHEVRRRSVFIDRDDRPPDIAYRKMRPTGYLQFGHVNQEVPASPWALPLPTTPKGDALRAELDKVAEACRFHYGPGLLHLLVLAVLAPGGTVPRHKDMGHNRGWKRYSHHLHLPLIGAQHGEFTIDDETFVLEAGGLYEIDNLRPHSTQNLGRRCRVNVMIDYCPAANVALREASLTKPPA